MSNQPQIDLVVQDAIKLVEAERRSIALVASLGDIGFTSNALQF